MNPLVIYDGHCVLCNRAVMWLIKHDAQKKLQFISRENPTLHEHLKGYSAPLPHSDSLWLYHPPHWYEYSDAVLQALRFLPAPWRFVSYLRITPRSLRNAVYRVMAKHRYAWFGRHDVCPMPPAEWRDRFIDQPSDNKL